jgi:drug/metabolite transporter superfamily protein YnfA
MTENTNVIAAVDAERAGSGAGLFAVFALSIFALLGVFLTAHAVNGAFQLFGGLLAVFSILMLFRVIALLTPSQH